MALRTRNNLAGALLVLGILQFVMVFLLVSAYFGYSSDLTISYILYKNVYADVSEGIAGIAVVAGAFLARKRISNAVYPFMIAGGCAFLISIFNLTYGTLHVFLTALLLISGIAAMVISKGNWIFRKVSVVLAGLSVLGGVLFFAGVFSHGLTERLAFFPLMGWGIALGVLLLFHRFS